jgi:dienelactone hydrolase
VAVQTGEGKLDIIYTPTSVPAGPITYGGYLARPTFKGEWPTVLVFGPEPTPTSTVKDYCRILARHGIAALAPDLTANHSRNLRISRSVASFLKDPTGEWSNGQLGYGVLSFGVGIFDLAMLARQDSALVAGAMVASPIDSDAAELLGETGVRGLAIMSRGDDSTDVDAAVEQRNRLPSTTFVVYPSGDRGFWDVDADGFDDARYEDTVERVVDFFTEHLPARI